MRFFPIKLFLRTQKHLKLPFSTAFKKHPSQKDECLIQSEVKLSLTIIGLIR